MNLCLSFRIANTTPGTHIMKSVTIATVELESSIVGGGRSDTYASIRNARIGKKYKSDFEGLSQRYLI